MRTVRNSGTIAATLAGEKGDAGAVIDRSGTLGLVENTGKIAARITPTDDANDKDDADSDAGNEVVTGRAVALDLSANTSGAVVRQSRASSTADAPSIVGDVAFGSGADRFELLGGTYSGALSFGAGADTFIVDGGAVSSGRISDSDGRLAIDVRKGTLAVANGTPLALSSLSIGAEGRLAIAIDPTSSSATRFDVAGAAVIASGAKVEIGLTSLVRGSREFEILRAGSLTLGNATTTLAGAPFLYTSSLRQSAGGNALLVAIRPKTTAELGLNRSGAQAFGAVFDRLDRDKRIEAAFLSARTNAEFTGLYNQLLPEHAGASLLSAAAISSALSTAASQPVRAAVGEGGDTGIWLQEIIVNTKHDAVDTTGFRAKSFGVAGGVERVRGDHAFGIAATFASTTYKDRFAAADESVHMQTAQAALYWRMASGRLKADARVGAGHVWFDSDRKLVSEAHGLDLSASAKWTGWLADAHAAASYDLGTGWLVARPELGLDFIYLKEKGYRETGGGAGFDLAVDARSSDLLRGTAALVLGARFGEAVRWGPEVRAGVRHRLSGNAATTRGRFVSGGSDFALSPEDVPDTEKLVQLAFRTESDGMSFAIEGGTAFDSSYDQYDLRAVIRFAF
jgi:outer membrane autotransporter protein